MKIFFYIPTLLAGGAEKQCALVAAGLRQHFGYDVSIILDYANQVKESNRVVVEHAGVEIIGLPRGTVKAFAALCRLFSRNRDAVLFTYLARSNLVGAVAARLVGLRKVYSGIRASWLPRKKWLSEILVNRFLATGTIFNSYRGMAKFVKEGFAAGKCSVISNGIELGDDISATRDSSEVRVVTVGRFMPIKDYLTWFRVIRKVRDMGLRITAHVVGWGPLESDVKGWIGALHLEDIVRLYPSDCDVAALLRTSDVYLSTSTSEGVSNSILEAMNARLPVVATDVGDNNRMIENGQSGYLAAVRDVAALACGVEKLARSASLRRVFGMRARAILRGRYASEIVIGQYDDLIRMVR